MQFILYIIIGFVAQMIDGTLGMAYGVSCRTFLTTFANIPHNISSALVHYAEIPTSFTLMLSHMKMKNIDKKIFIQLITTGIIGSILGAYIIVLNFIWIEIIVDIYLIIMGIVVLSKGINLKKKRKIKESKPYIYFLGFIGAFFDASGGGGYGPIVNGTLLSNTDNPKKTIGTVNSSEFFITLSSSITFIFFITNIKKYLLILFGLVIGGVIASPIAAKLCMKLNEKKLYILTGLMLIILNIYNIINYLS